MRGAGVKENTRKSRLVEMAAGHERCSAWRRGTPAQPVAPVPSQRAYIARRNSRAVIQQQRRGHPSPVVVDGTSAGDRSLERGVPTGSARSLPDGMCTVGAGSRSRGRYDGQRRSRPWDSRRDVSTPCGWTRGPAGPETIINSRRRSGTGSGCSSARANGDAARRRQGSRRRRVARRRRRTRPDQ